MSFFACIALTLYSWLGTLFYPLVGIVFFFRSRRGKEDSPRRSERYGYGSAPRPSGFVVWLHAASVGEFRAVLPLVRHLNQKDKLSVVFTTGTVTSARIAEKELLDIPNVIHQYVPIDIRSPVVRFLNHWRPDLVIFAESEIWPMKIIELSHRSVPIILVNARLSDVSYRRWLRLTWISNFLFGCFSDILAQSQSDADRFGELGGSSVRVVGNLKIDAIAPSVDSSSLDSLQTQVGSRPTWLGVSTHSGEERICGLAHKLVSERFQDILTIIVPRHPDRSASIVSELNELGLSVVTRSSGESIDSSTDIFLGDTIGEIGVYLGLSRISFMGKSLTAKGGQNPIESILSDCGILVGSDTSNFREIYDSLFSVSGARLVSDETSLSEHIIDLLSDSDSLDLLCSSARDVLSSMTGSLLLTTDIIDSHLEQRTQY